MALTLKLKIAMDKDERLLIAVKGGKRIYAKPLKPGAEPQKDEKTGEPKRKCKFWGAK